MPHTLTWTDNLNVTHSPASTKDAANYHAWWLLSALTGGTAWAAAPVGGRWTLFGSSDSLTAGLDTTDRLSLAGAYDIADWVRNGAGVHTWCVLRSPIVNGSRWYLIIDYNTAQDYSFNIYWSKAAPTGGTTSARPTATDEWQTQAASTPLTVVKTAQGTTGQRLSIGMSSTGHWWHNWNSAGTSYNEFFMAFAGTSGYHASDGYPVVTFSVWGNGANALLPDTLRSTSINQTRRWDGGVATNYLIIPANSSIGANTADALSGNWPFFPCNVFCYNTATSQAYRGLWQDFCVLPSASVIAQGNTVAESSVILWSVCGNFLVPASAALIVG